MEGRVVIGPAGRDAGRYAAAALALGLIGYFASEALFWSFSPEGASVAEIAMTVVAYALAAACVLSAAGAAGLGGLSGAFLGGCLVGFLVEGVVVATMYDAFPVQLVWTPIAWHGLVTGAGVFALHRAAVHWPILRQVAAMAALGLGGGVWAAYWPIERAVLPGAAETAAYLIGSGLAAVAGFLILDRIGRVPVPGKWGGTVMPLLAAALFLAQSAVDPRPQRIALPVVAGLTVWAMRRAGRPGAAISFGAAAPVWRHLLFLIAPALTAAIADFVIRGGPGYAVSMPVAVTTGSVGLGWWLWLLWRALVRPVRPHQPG